MPPVPLRLQDRDRTEGVTVFCMVLQCAFFALALFYHDTMTMWRSRSATFTNSDREVLWEGVPDEKRRDGFDTGSWQEDEGGRLVITPAFSRAAYDPPWISASFLTRTQAVLTGPTDLRDVHAATVGVC